MKKLTAPQQVLNESRNRCLANARYHRAQAKKPGRQINDTGLAQAFTREAARLAAQIRRLS